MVLGPKAATPYLHLQVSSVFLHRAAFIDLLLCLSGQLKRLSLFLSCAYGAMNLGLPGRVLHDQSVPSDVTFLAPQEYGPSLASVVNRFGSASKILQASGHWRVRSQYNSC